MEKIPEFLRPERQVLMRWILVADPPPPWLFGILKERQLAHMARLEVEFRKKVLQNRIEFYEGISEILK